MSDENKENKQTPPNKGKAKKEVRQIVDEKLVEKSKKAHEELATLKDRKERYEEAEAKARKERQQVGREAALAGAKVLEAVDTASVAAKRLDDKHSRGTGARIDAVRAAANVDVAESAFKRKERDYKEQQVRVAKLSLRSDVVDLKAEIKELEAETIDLTIAKSQLHGIGMEYRAQMQKENPTEEELNDRETLKVLFESLQQSVAQLEDRMANRAEAIKLKEEALSGEALELLQKDILADEDEYLDLAKMARKERENTSEAVLEARKQEAEFIKELEQDAHSKERFLSRHTDSKLLTALKDAQDAKREVLKTGSELFEERIREAEENLEAARLKGKDTFFEEQVLAELTEAKSKVATTELSAKAIGAVATAGSLTAEGIRLAGEAAGAITDATTSVVGAVTDLQADVLKFVPYAGVALHIGLHIAAGVERAAGHTLSGLERAVGETIRGEIRINTEGVKAEAEMEADAAKLGLTDTSGFALSAGMRHGEVERHIAYDRVSHVMAEAGGRVVEDIKDALKKAGIPLDSMDTLMGDEGFGQYFLSGLDEKGVFANGGEYGAGLKSSLVALFNGKDPSSALNKFGETTAVRAGVEGFIGGFLVGLNNTGLIQGSVYNDLQKALNRSRNAVKVQSDYSVIDYDSKRTEGFSERSEVSKKLGYTHWFDLQGDKEAAQRLASQKSMSVRDLFPKANDSEYDPDEIAHQGDREDVEDDDFERGSSGGVSGGDDEDYESATSMDGSGYVADKGGFLKSPYGSLIRGENRSRTGVQEELSGLKKTLKAVKPAAMKEKIKKVRRRRRRIIVGAIAILLIITTLVTSLFIQAFLGAIGGIVNLKHGGHWGHGDCDCGCLEQFYSGGVPGGVVELGEGVISGSLENNGIIVVNIPEEITQTRTMADGSVVPKNLPVQKNWAVYEFGGSHLDTHPPYDSEGLPYVVVASKLIDPTTPDDSYLYRSTVVGNNPVYARLLLKEENGSLSAVIVRINTNEGKAHTFNKYPGESTRYTPEEFRAAQLRTTANGVDLRPFVDEQVTYNVPSGIFQTGIAYPNSANAGGYIKYDGPWMPMNADGSTIEFHQSSALSAFRAEHPNARLLQIQVSFDKGRLENLALVEPSASANAPLTPAYETETPTTEETVPATTEPTTDTETEEATETPETTETTPVSAPAVQGAVIICDCPLDCSCWDIHGRGSNIVRSDGTVVYGSRRTGQGFNIPVDEVKAKGGYIVHEDKIPGGVVAYYQNDDGLDNPNATWANLPYDSRTIGSNGCGPSTLAIIVSTLDPDNIVNPADTAAVATQQGWATNIGQGSYHSIMWEGPEYYGLKVEPVLSNADSYDAIDTNGYAKANFTPIMDAAKERMITALEEGKLIFGIFDSHQRAYGSYPEIRNANVFTTGGHFFAIVGISEDRTKVYLSDPGSKRRTGMEWDIDQIFTAVTRGLFAVSK